MDKKHKGALAELIACKYLLEQGYEVFRNVSAHGLADLIGWKPDKLQTVSFDVKTIDKYVDKEGKTVYYPRKLSDEQRQLGVQLLTVNPDTGAVEAS